MELQDLLESQSSYDPDVIVLAGGSARIDAAHGDAGDKSLAARFCSETTELFRLMIRHLSTQVKVPKDAATSLGRSYSRLKLWSDGYGVSQGKLDDVFARSRKIRSATLKSLGSIGETLTERAYLSVILCQNDCLGSNPMHRTGWLC